MQVTLRWSGVVPLVVVASIGMALVSGLGPNTVLAVELAVVAGLIFAKYPFHTTLALMMSAPLLLSPFTVGALTLDNVVTLIALVATLMLAIKHKAIPLTITSLLPLSIFLAVVISGLANNVEFLTQATRFASIAATPWIAAMIPVHSRFAMRLVVTLVALGALTILQQPITQFPSPYTVTEGVSVVRYGGFFGHPNFAAYAIGLVLIATIANHSYRRTFLLYALLGTALLMTSSLGAILAILPCLLFILVTSFRTAILSLVMFFVGGITAGNVIIERVEFVLNDQTGSNSFAWRVTQWRQSLEVSEGRRMLGIGYQQARVLLDNNLGVHSAYVQLFTELGLVGTSIVFIAILTSFLAIKMNRQVLSLWIFVLLTSVTDPVLLYPSSLILLVTFTQIMVQSSYNMKRKIHED